MPRHATSLPFIALALLTACEDAPDTGDPLACGLPSASPEEEVDVLVIGSGPAGFAAAWEAGAAGAAVRVLERDPVAGGAGRYSAHMYAAGTRFQAAMGFEDDPERALADWGPGTGGDPTDPQIVAFVEDSAAVVEWLADEFGAEVTLAKAGADLAGSRLHLVAIGTAPLGGWYGEWLGDAIRTDAPAGALVRDADCAVRGAWITDGAGDRSGWIRAGAVVVATGGFARDVERVIADRPGLADAGFLFEAAPGSDGGGHPLLEAAGAGAHNQGHYGMYVHAVADWRPGFEGEALLSPGFQSGLTVDLGGRRVRDESDQSDLTTVDVLLEAEGSRLVTLLPASVVATTVFSVPGYNWAEDGVPEDLPASAAREAGALGTWPTVADVAAGEGIDPETLQATFARYEGFAAKGEDPDFGKPARFLVPFGADPIGVVDPWAGAAKAFTGVRTDGEARVLDADGEPIPGLWAAGEVAGMLGTDAVGRGFEGSMTACYHMGRLAGRSAAAAALAGR